TDGPTFPGEDFICVKPAADRARDARGEPRHRRLAGHIVERRIPGARLLALLRFLEVPYLDETRIESAMRDMRIDIAGCGQPVSCLFEFEDTVDRAEHFRRRAEGARERHVIPGEFRCL